MSIRSSFPDARPRVICHMAASIDGRIVVDGWPMPQVVRREYEQVHASYGADAWMCGRVTMEPFAGDRRTDDEVARVYAGVAREDFIAPGSFASFAIAVDPRGRLAWRSNEIDGDHVVAILSDRVSDEYLAFLRARGVSYVLAGGHAVDLPLALDRIRARLGVRTLMLEGGGGINGSMLHAGLVDEISLLLVPVADGRVDSASVFDSVALPSEPRQLSLESVERRAGDVVWLRYRVAPRQEP